jgi:hypothetical protein
VALEGRGIHSLCQATEGLLHSQKAPVCAEDRIDRIMGRAGLLDKIAEGTLVVEGTTNLIADCSGDWRWEGVLVHGVETPPIAALDEAADRLQALLADIEQRLRD